MVRLETLFTRATRAFYATTTVRSGGTPPGYELELGTDSAFSHDPMLERRKRAFDRRGRPHQMYRLVDPDHMTAAYAWLTVGPAEVPFALDLRLLVPARTAYVWDCRTAPEHRGLGLYTELIRHVAAVATDGPATAATICCDPANEASRRGIESAGFAPLGEVDVYRVGPVRLLHSHRWRLTGGSRPVRVIEDLRCVR